MKTTKYEISKLLFDIGFKAKKCEELIWNYDGQEKWAFPAYNFETIFEQLPTTLKHGQEFYSLSLWFEDAALELRIGYKNSHGGTIHCLIKQEHESLADLVARLLILLHEHKVI